MTETLTNEEKVAHIEAFTKAWGATPEEMGVPVTRDNLHPALRNWFDDGTLDYITTGEMGWKKISHPLLIELFPVGPKHLNTRYEAKRKAFGDAVREGDYSRALGFIEKPYRLDMLFKWYRGGRVTAEQAHDLFAFAWTATEYVHSHEEDALELLDAIGYVCDEDDEAAIIRPADDEEFTVYRGQNDPDNPLGISWSLTLSVAQWFAHRFLEAPNKGLVAIGKVKGRHIRARFEGRGETEAIIDPSDIYDLVLWDVEAE